MAEQIADDKFKSEVMRFIEVASQKFDGLTADVRSNSFELDRIGNGVNRLEEKVSQVEEKVSRVEEKVSQVEEKVSRMEAKLNNVSADLKLLSRQFTDVAGVTITNHEPRIGRLEERVDVLESEAH